ncbi:MAG TPA: SDR family oxidoreductase, partial [Chloroflexi bacterium]|nr:SDR family oxidoreductase [Chloroflexota bacterium]
MPETQLHERVVIITGASSGIGRATALALAREGAHVTLAARNIEALERVAVEIQELGGKALAVPCDVSHRDQIETLVERTLTEWGRIDVLVANAGRYVQTPIRDATPEHFEQSMAVNFYGAIAGVLAVLPHMLRQGSGHVVLISSMDARKGIPPDAPYIAAKAALAMFGDVLRQELHGTGVRVTVVYPGRVDTPLIEHLRVPWISAKIAPEKVADAIVRALHRNAAQIITPPQARLLDCVQFLSPRLADWFVRTLGLEGQ